MGLPNRIRDQIFQNLGTRDEILAPMTVQQAQSIAVTEAFMGHLVSLVRRSLTHSSKKFFSI
jgi:hypothetical protein